MTSSEGASVLVPDAIYAGRRAERFVWASEDQRRLAA